MLHDQLKSKDGKDNLIKICSGGSKFGDNEIYVEEWRYVEQLPIWDGVDRICLPLKGMKKEEFIKRTVAIFELFGTVEEVPNKGYRALLNMLLSGAAGKVIEEKLRPFVFEHLRSGTKLVALKHHDENLSKQTVVIKVARKGVDFNSWIIRGYKHCKDNLGDFGTPTTMIRDLRVRVLDTERIPRLVVLRDVIVQARCLVAGDIIPNLERVLLKTKQQIIRPDEKKRTSVFDRFRKANTSQIETKGSAEIRKIKKEYEEGWVIPVKKLGLYDKDTKTAVKNGEIVPFRNYGYLPLIEDFDYRDWAAVDHYVLGNKKRLVSFDLNDFWPTEEALMEYKLTGRYKGRRIPDVFPDEVRAMRFELLDRIFI